jgi:hypothetical protein
MSCDAHTLFNDAVINEDYTVSSGQMISETEACGVNRPWPYFMYYPGISNNGLRKTMKTLLSHRLSVGVPVEIRTICARDRVVG